MVVKKKAPVLKKPTKAAITAAIKSIKKTYPKALKSELYVRDVNYKLELAGYHKTSSVVARKIWDELYKKTPAKKRAVSPLAKKRATVKKLGNNQVHGGPRKNSGRKHGAATVKTRAIADKLVAENEITPLEYMLGVLRETPEKLKAQHKKGEIDTVEYTIKMQEMIKRKDQAAEKAAPYIHPRLSSIEANVGLHGQDRFVELMAAMDKDGDSS